MCYSAAKIQNYFHNDVIFAHLRNSGCENITFAELFN